MLFKLALPLILTAGLGAPVALRTGLATCHDLAARALGVTEAQKAAFQALHEKHKPALVARAGAFLQARSVLLDAALDPANSTDSLRPLQLRTAEAGYELGREVRSLYLEVLPQLTDAQRAKALAGLDLLRTHAEGFAQGHHDLVMHVLADRLDLTADQRQALETLHEARRPALQEKRDTLHGTVVNALQAAMDPATPEPVLRQQHQKVTDAALAMGSEARSLYLASLPVLTEAQRAKGHELIAQVRAHAESLRKAVMGF